MRPGSSPGSITPARTPRPAAVFSPRSTNSFGWLRQALPRCDVTQTLGGGGEFRFRRQQVGAKAKEVAARVDEHAAALELTGPRAGLSAAHDDKRAAIVGAAFPAHAALAQVPDQDALLRQRI